MRKYLFIIVIAMLSLTACGSDPNKVAAGSGSTTTSVISATTDPTANTASSTGNNTAPTATPSGTAATGNGSQYGLNPQPQIGHPSMYFETGVPCNNTPTAPGLTCSDVDNHTRNWKFNLQTGSSAVIGGFNVDNVADGVYKTIESGSVNVTVTDGFVSVVEGKWLCDEFNFRVGQAVQYNWAHSHVTPPSGCAASGSGSVQSASAPAAAPAGTRQTTGDGKVLPFKAGTPVIGVDIILPGMGGYHSCYLANPSVDGSVKTGVIYPSPAEIAAAKPC